MNVAAVIWEEIYEYEQIIEKIKNCMRECEDQGVNLVVFPALIGNYFCNPQDFIQFSRELSSEYPELLLCPGSHWELDGEEVYHTSYLWRAGEILLQQRQLYLARWEREQKLSRGRELAIAKVDGIQVAVLLSTDVFYPQVARYAAMAGVDLVLSPVAIRGDGNRALQLCGLWQNVQQNLLFAVESGYKGEYRGVPFSSHSMIHAPLAITEKEDGFLKTEEEHAVANLVTARIEFPQKQDAVRLFDPLRQLNLASYKNLFE